MIFKYDIEKDLENYKRKFLNHDYPDYGRGRLDLQSVISDINNKDFTKEDFNKEEYIHQCLEKFYKKNKEFFDSQLRVVEEEWKRREEKYIRALEDFMGIKIDFEVKCYLTTLGIAPYSCEKNYFYLMMTSSTSRQITTIAHEFLHLVFLKNFNEILSKRGVDKQGKLEINEALTMLINFKFFDLFIVPDYNKKPSIDDLKKEVIRNCKENKTFSEMLDRLIEMRT